MLNSLIDALPVIGGLAILGILSYTYYSKPEWREKIIYGLVWTVRLLPFLASRIPDRKGVFDAHDSLVVTRRVADKMLQALLGDTNVDFESTRDDIVRILQSELDTYRKAGVRGVPDLTPEDVEEVARAVFLLIKLRGEHLSNENSSRNNTENQDNG